MHQQLHNYIKRAEAAGQSHEEIKAQLVAAGWPQTHVNVAAFGHHKKHRAAIAIAVLILVWGAYFAMAKVAARVEPNLTETGFRPTISAPVKSLEALRPDSRRGRPVKTATVVNTAGWTPVPNEPIDSGYILWSPTKRLEWSNFQSPTPASQDEGASINTPIISYANMSARCKGQVGSKACTYRIDSFTAYAAMLPKQSHVFLERATDYGLAHEQIHFDIAEMFARQTEKRLGVLVGQTGTHEALLDKKGAVERKLEQEYLAMQERYDTETDHSLNQPAQERWAACVQNWLVTNPEILDCKS